MLIPKTLQSALLLIALFALISLGSLISGGTPLASRTIAYAQNQTGSEMNEKVNLIFPTTGYITQYFHDKHGGIDIHSNKRPKVWSAQAGTVTAVVNNCGEISPECGNQHGNQVLIDHGNGIQTFYSHLEYSTVQVGQAVKQGETIGKMGRSGHVIGPTGILLHFEVRLNGLNVNPLDFITDELQHNQES